MENNNMDMQDVPETPVAPEEVPETPQEPEVDVADLQAKLEESENKRNQLYERLKKAESKEAVASVPTATADPSQLSPKDYLALQESSVKADDFDEVQDFAKFKGITISEALQNNTLKSILADRAEERKTAEATQTKSPRGERPQSGEDLLRKAEEGDVPETAAGLKKLAQARMARRKAQA